MPKVRFSQEDLLQNKQLDAGFYKLKVKAITEGKGTTDPTSTTYTTDFVIEEGPNKGVPIRHWFSEKRMGNLVEFVRCFGKVGSEEDVELSDTVGRNVIAYIQYEEGAFAGNKIKGFKRDQ